MSPGSSTAAGAAARGLSTTQDSSSSGIMQHIEDFLLGHLLPLLGPECRSAAAIEAAVSDELLGLHLANAQLGQRLSKWCVVVFVHTKTQQQLAAAVPSSRRRRACGIVWDQGPMSAMPVFMCCCRMAVAQELQELVQLQQQELHKLQQQQQQANALHAAADPSSRYISAATAGGPWQQQPPAAAGQLEAANAELKQQLTGTTARLQDMEAAMSRLLQQQVSRLSRAGRFVLCRRLWMWCCSLVGHVCVCEFDWTTST